MTLDCGLSREKGVCGDGVCNFTSFGAALYWVRSDTMRVPGGL
jgi:hypothetical protein